MNVADAAAAARRQRGGSRASTHRRQPRMGNLAAACPSRVYSSRNARNAEAVSAGASSIGTWPSSGKVTNRAFGSTAR